MESVMLYRGSLGLTQKQLAEKIGCSRGTITYWESKICKKISDEYEKALCDLFKCSKFELYGLDNFIIKPNSDEDKRDVIKYVYGSIRDEATRKSIIEGLKDYEINKNFARSN